MSIFTNRNRIFCCVSSQFFVHRLSIDRQLWPLFGFVFRIERLFHWPPDSHHIPSRSTAHVHIGLICISLCTREAKEGTSHLSRSEQTLLSRFCIKKNNNNLCWHVYKEMNELDLVLLVSFWVDRVCLNAGVAKIFGPRAIFRNVDEGAGHTT